MPKNKVISESTVAGRECELRLAEMELHKFNRLCPDEASCIKDVYKRFTGSFEFVCCKCGSRSTKEIDERSFLCLTCHKRCWFTAGTPFFKFKKIKPWLFAQWLVEKGVKLNGSQLAGLVKISKSTGNCIMRKIGTLTAGITEESNGEKLSVSAAPDVLIQLREHRLLQAHLKVERRKVIKTKEQEHNQDKPQGQFIDLVPSPAATMPAKIQPQVSELLAILTDMPQDFETLLRKLDCSVPWMSANLTLLELDGLVKRLAGDRFVKAKETGEILNVKRTCARQKMSSVTSKTSSVTSKTLRLNIVVAIVDSIKLAWSDLSKIIVNQLRRLTGAK